MITVQARELPQSLCSRAVALRGAPARPRLQEGVRLECVSASQGVRVELPVLKPGAQLCFLHNSTGGERRFNLVPCPRHEDAAIAQRQSLQLGAMLVNMHSECFRSRL